MSIAEDLITEARTYAQDTLASSISALSGASAALHSISSGPPGTPPSMNLRPPMPSSVGDPDPYTGARFEVVEFDVDPPETTDVPALTLPQAPGAAPDVLDFEEPPQPSGGEPNPELLNEVPEINNELSVPDAQDLLAKANTFIAPTLTNIVVPAAPAYQEPEFLGVRPNFSAVTQPTDLDERMRTQYSTISPIMRAAINTEIDTFLDREFPSFRTGMAAVEERLATYLEGGTALTPEVETAIYNRTLDKTNTDATRANRKAWGEAARAGFLVPSAILLAQIQDIDQARRDTNARAAIDIAIKMAELEQQNLQFAVTASAQYRQMAVTAAMAYYSGLVQINGQAIDYARAVVDAIVKAYEVAVKHAELQARIYEAETRVYEAKLRGAMAVIEAYVATVKGLEAQANVETAKVNAYRAKIEALQAEASIYRAVVDGVVAAAGLERAKVDIYTARVQGYGAQVNAYSARWNGYEAATRGQVAKMQASSEQIRAYVAQVGAYEATVRAKALEIDALARSKEAAIRSYQVQVEGYAALTDAQAKAVKAEIETYSVELAAFVAKANADAKYSEAEIASYEAGQRGLVTAAQLHLANLAATNANILAKAKGLAEVSVAASSVFSAQAQSALAGMNSLATVVTEATA